MALYKLTDNGVIRTDTMTFIPEGAGHLWAKYVEWSASNTADPHLSGADKKDAKKRYIQESRETKILTPFTTTTLPLAAPATHSWQTNGNGNTRENEGIRNINAVVTMVGAGMDLPGDFTYRDADNNDVPMTNADMVALGGALLLHINGVYKESWTMKAAVDAIADDDVDIDTKLAAIDWS